MPAKVERPYRYEIVDDHTAVIPVKYKDQWFVTLVDVTDAELVADYSWGLNKQGYIQAMINKKTVTLHRFLLNLHAESKLIVDHINGFRADNRRANLRMTTYTSNQHNVKRNSKRNSSGFRGVGKHSQCNKWQASVNVDKKLKYLGLYDTAEEAARAYDRFVIANFDEHAFTNFDRSEYA